VRNYLTKGKKKHPPEKRRGKKKKEVEIQRDKTPSEETEFVNAFRM